MVIGNGNFHIVQKKFHKIKKNIFQPNYVKADNISIFGQFFHIFNFPTQII